MVERLSFAFENTCHASVESRGIVRPKRHDRKARFVIIRSEESKLLLILMMDMDMMVAGFVTQSDENETTIKTVEAADSIIPSIEEWDI